MTLIADSDVDDPIIRALQEVRYDIRRLSEISAPARPDKAVMEAVLKVGKVLVTKDIGLAPQAYQYAQMGLTVVQPRWKNHPPECWQQMVEIILRDGKQWEEIAGRQPSVISVTYRRGSRARSWGEVPPRIMGALGADGV